LKYYLYKQIAIAKTDGYGFSSSWALQLDSAMALYLDKMTETLMEKMMEILRA